MAVATHPTLSLLEGHCSDDSAEHVALFSDPPRAPSFGWSAPTKQTAAPAQLVATLPTEELLIQRQTSSVGAQRFPSATREKGRANQHELTLVGTTTVLGTKVAEQNTVTNSEGSLKPYLSLLGILEFPNNSFQGVNSDIWYLEILLPSEYCSSKGCAEKMKYFKLLLPCNCSERNIISVCSILKLNL